MANKKIDSLRVRAMAAVLLCCTLPMAASVQAENEISSSATIAIREIQIRGGEIISPAVLDELLPLYRNRNVSSEELLQLAQKLTAHLIERGYVNSGVILPDQKVADGIVYLEVVAGRVSRIVVRGNKHLSDRYIISRLASSSTEVFNINDAVQRLQLLQRNPRIKKLNADLKPSVEKGSALLNVDVEEANVYGWSVGVDNHISPNVGTQQASMDFYDLSLLRQGDTLTLSYRKAQGFSSGSVGYSLPINAYDTTVAVNYDHSTSKIISEPFVQLGIEGTTTNYSVVLRQPLITSLRSEFALGLGLQKQRVESFLLGEPFSFSASDPEGVSEVTVVQFTQEWVNRGPARVLALRSNFNFGLSALHASVGGEADGRFLEWLLQSEWLQKLSWRDGTLGAKLQLHLSNDALPAYRKFGLGGANSVRGYRENLVTRDNGAFASVEWTLPLLHLPVYWLSTDRADGEIAIKPFVDYGYGWDYFRDQGEATALASVGIGVQWHIGKNSNAELQYAKALIAHAATTAERVLQDEGVHFSVRLGF